MYDDVYPRQGHTTSEFRESRMEERILFEVDFEKFIHRNLDIRELVVSRMLVAGYSVSEIARHQRTYRRSITRVVTALRCKLRKFLHGR